MGDHLPDFIAMSFDERRGGPPRPFVADEEDDEAVDVADTQVETQIDTAAEPASKPTDEAPKPKRRRRVKKTEAGAPASNDADSAA